MIMVKCPVCAPRASLPENDERLPCTVCKGTLEISEGHAKEIAKWRYEKEQRLAKGESLWTAASRLGISTLELSKRENGLVVWSQEETTN